MRKLVVAVAALLALTLAGWTWDERGVAQASPQTTQALLDQVSTTFAMRPSSIKCVDPNQDAILADAWGYTYLAWDYAVLDGTLCDAIALGRGIEPAAWVDPPQNVHASSAPRAWLVPRFDRNPSTPHSEPWRTAVAISVLTHESYHVRHWRYRADEAQVECQAIRHWSAAAGMLGYDAVAAELLYPWAAAAHFRIGVRAPAYNLPSCKVPWPW